MTEENEKSRLNWARKEAREGAINRLYEQAYTCSFDDAGRKTWDSMSGDEQAHFLESKELPSDFEFSHLYSAAHYQDIAHDPSTGYLTSYLDHRYGDHGGNTSIPLHGSPRDPDWRDSWGTQEVDASTPEGQKYLGMTDDVSSDLAHQIDSSNDDDVSSDLEYQIDSSNDDDVSSDLAHQIDSSNDDDVSSDLEYESTNDDISSDLEPSVDSSVEDSSSLNLTSETDVSMSQEVDPTSTETNIESSIDSNATVDSGIDNNSW